MIRQKIFFPLPEQNKTKPFRDDFLIQASLHTSNLTVVLIIAIVILLKEYKYYV